MERIILFMLTLTLIGSSALAQGLPSGPPVLGSNPPTGGATAGAPAGVSAAYGTVQGIQDPHGTAAAASRFGTPSGVQGMQDPYGTAAAASRFGTSQAPVSPQTPSGAGSATQPPR